jgi:hypothetical protein
MRGPPLLSYPVISKGRGTKNTERGALPQYQASRPSSHHANQTNERRHGHLRVFLAAFLFAYKTLNFKKFLINQAPPVFENLYHSFANEKTTGTRLVILNCTFLLFCLKRALA